MSSGTAALGISPVSDANRFFAPGSQKAVISPMIPTRKYASSHSGCSRSASTNTTDCTVFIDEYGSVVESTSAAQLVVSNTNVTTTAELFSVEQFTKENGSSSAQRSRDLAGTSFEEMSSNDDSKVNAHHNVPNANRTRSIRSRSSSSVEFFSECLDDQERGEDGGNSILNSNGGGAEPNFVPLKTRKRTGSSVQTEPLVPSSKRVHTTHQDSGSVRSSYSGLMYGRRSAEFTAGKLLENRPPSRGNLSSLRASGEKRHGSACKTTTTLLGEQPRRTSAAKCRPSGEQASSPAKTRHAMAGNSHVAPVKKSSTAPKVSPAASATPIVTSHVTTKSRMSTGVFGMKSRKPTLPIESKLNAPSSECGTESSAHPTQVEVPERKRRTVERHNEDHPQSVSVIPQAAVRTSHHESTTDPAAERGVIPKEARKKRVPRRTQADGGEAVTHQRSSKEPAPACARDSHVEENPDDESGRHPDDPAGSGRAWRKRPKYPVRQISRRPGAEARKVDELLREIDEEYDSIMGSTGGKTRYAPSTGNNRPSASSTQTFDARPASPKRTAGPTSTSSPRVTGTQSALPTSPPLAFTNPPNASSNTFFQQSSSFCTGDESQPSPSGKGSRGQRSLNGSHPSPALPKGVNGDGKAAVRLFRLESCDTGKDGSSNESPAGPAVLPPLAPSRGQPHQSTASISAEDLSINIYSAGDSSSNNNNNGRVRRGSLSTERAVTEVRRAPSSQRTGPESSHDHRRRKSDVGNDSLIDTSIAAQRRGSAPCRPANCSRRGSLNGNSSNTPVRGSPMRYRNARAASTKPIYTPSNSAAVVPRFQPLVPLEGIRLFVSSRGGDAEESSGKAPPEEGRANEGDDDPNDDEAPGDGPNDNGNDKGAGRPQGRGKRNGRGNGGDRSDDDDDNGDEAPVEDAAWNYTPPPNNQRTFVFPEDNISFSSEFDSGNLIQMERTGPFRYNMWSCQDCGNTPYQTNNRQWFHFAVRGGSKGVNVTVTMIGLMHSMMFTFGWSPVMSVMPGGKGEYVRLPWKPTVVSLDEMPPTPGYPMLVHKVWPKEAKRAAAAAAAAAAVAAAAATAESTTTGAGEEAEKGMDAACVASPSDAAPSPDAGASPTTNDDKFPSPTTTPTTANAASPTEQTGTDAAIITVAAPTATKRTKKKDTVAMNITFDFTIDSDVPLNSPFSLDDPNCPAIFIASNHPYPYCRLQRAITQWAAYVDSIANQVTGCNPLYFHRETLCESLDGRNVDVLTITDTSGIATELEPLFSEADRIPVSSANGTTTRPHTFPKKRYVVLTARVHPGECPASHTMHGCIEFLMNRKDPRAAVLRQNFVFVLVPMINPDGVARGHSRSDSCGINLNRMYRNPSKKRHPAPYCIREMARSLAKTQRLALFIDMHAHANKRGTFIYGNAMDAESQVQNMLYTKLVSLNTPYFDFSQCNLSETNMFAVGKSGEGKDHSSRVTVFQDTGLIHCYTIEASHVAGTQYMNPLVALPTIPGEEVDILPGTVCPKYSPSTFADTGRGLLVGLLDLIARNPVSRLTCTQFGSTRGVAQWINRQIHIEIAESLFKLAFSTLGGADVLRNGVTTAAGSEESTTDNRDSSAAASGAALQADPLNKVLSVLTHESIPNVMTVRDSRSLPPFTVKNVRAFTAPDIVKQLLAQVPPQGPPRSLISGTRSSRGARGASPANPQPPQAGAGKRAKLTKK